VAFEEGPLMTKTRWGLQRKGDWGEKVGGGGWEKTD